MNNNVFLLFSVVMKVLFQLKWTVKYLLLQQDDLHTTYYQEPSNIIDALLHNHVDQDDVQINISNTPFVYTIDLGIVHKTATRQQEYFAPIIQELISVVF